jgi:hypothetical protein
MTAQPANASGLNFDSFPRGKRLTAYHEAAHAVAALASGCFIREVRIAGDYICRYHTGPNLNVAQRNVIDLAGWMAEAITLRDPSPCDWHVHDSFDKAEAGEVGHCDMCQVAHRIVTAHPGIEDRTLLVIAFRRHAGRTRWFLQVPEVWESVERVAHALLAVGVLYDAECRELVAEEILN